MVAILKACSGQALCVSDVSRCVETLWDNGLVLRCHSDPTCKTQKPKKEYVETYAAMCMTKRQAQKK